ncbi:cation transporter [Sansalvadorimonas verongulae]|uniref:cation transporter n=1 Tax=Sansalvadorimonas verongulae TaxID=2172824 RepID=UPI0012BD3F08|nr:cation transporter [Sansalvadorimonas verongulae]MTI13707.1 cation transporter [Sansalvadorimonas verongulae]
MTHINGDDSSTRNNYLLFTYLPSRMSQIRSYFLKLRELVEPAHHIPGRLRLKFHSPLVAQMAKMRMGSFTEQVANIPAFKNCEVHAARRSAILEYDPQLVDPKLLDIVFSQDQAKAFTACEQLVNALSNQ